jgi:hypothetical protein
VVENLKVAGGVSSTQHCGHLGKVLEFPIWHSFGGQDLRQMAFSENGGCVPGWAPVRMAVADIDNPTEVRTQAGEV